MSLQLRVLSGARAGQREAFESPLVAVGRHPQSDLRFDPEGDRDVSARHAEIRATDGRYTLRDAGSTNGTFVNGRRISADTELHSGDVISFGELGPKVEVQLGAQANDVARSPVSPTRGSAASARTAGDSARISTGERVAVAVRAETRVLRRIVIATAASFAVGLLTILLINTRAARARQAEIDAMLRRDDSLTTTFDREMGRMTGQVEGLDSALAAARHDGDALRSQMTAGRSSSTDAELASLRERLRQTEQRRDGLVAAARMDNETIARRSGAAIAMIAVQMPDGHAYSGTGFCLTSGGLVATNRHLVQDTAGVRATRYLVIFSDTKRWIPAHLVRTASGRGDDLALLQIDEAGRYPTVGGIAPSAERVRVGTPVAIIGYPLGVDTPMEGSGLTITARSTFTIGTVSKTLTDVLQIDSFAGEGSSGSPVFDGRGDVVGIVYGGARESNGRIVYAVPSERLTELVAH